MSIIHQALKRAERERSAELTPQPGVPLAASTARPRRRWRLGLAALGVTILLLAAVFGILRREPSRTASSAPGLTTSTPALQPKTDGRAASTDPPDPASPTPALAPAPVPAAAPALAVAPATPADSSRLNAEAVTAFREGRLEEAQLLLERILRLDPDMPEAHNNFGMVLRAQGRRAEAREEYQRALALLPGYPEALNNLGLVRSEEGDQDEAIRSFENALDSRPGYGSAHLNLAIVYDKLGKRADAFYHYRRFLQSTEAQDQDLVRRINNRLRQ